MPRLQLETDSYMDAAFLVPDEPLVPFKYLRAGPLRAREDRQGTGEIYLGRNAMNALDSRKFLAEMADC